MDNLKVESNREKKGDIIQHVTPDQDEKQRVFQREICDKVFSTMGILKNHVLSVHEKKRSLKCEVCDYSCSQKGDMKKHVSIHENKRPFKCEICD